MTDVQPEFTRKRLLDEALVVFAEQGYHRASIRDICRRADANSAAVHYHFGDKPSLYKAVFKSAMTELRLEQRPLFQNVSPLIALEGYYEVLLTGTCASGPSRRLAAIRAREEFEPSGLLEELWAQHIEPFHEHVRDFVCAVTGLARNKPDAETLCFSLAGLAMPYVHMPAVVNTLSPGLMREAGDIKALAKRLAEQALSLLLAAKEQHERPE